MYIYLPSLGGGIGLKASAVVILSAPFKQHENVCNINLY
jgi:hypothetical protein